MVKHREKERKREKNMQNCFKHFIVFQRRTILTLQKLYII